MNSMDFQNDFYEYYQRKRRRLLIIILSLSLIVVLVGGIICIRSIQKQETYTSSLAAADKYYAGNQYEAAIMAYKLSIREKPNEETPYLRISEVYLLLGDYTEAENFLREGYSRTKSNAILQKMQRLYIEASAPTSYTEEEMESMSAEVTINNTLFDWVSSYDYSDYVSNFGVAQITTESGELKLVFDGFAGECLYFNTADNSYIVDTARGLPYANRKPNYVKLNSMSAIFNRYTGVVTYEHLGELFGDSISVEAQGTAGKYVLKLEYRNCILEVECDEQGNITGYFSDAKLTPVFAGEIENAVPQNGGRHTGYVTNAVTGGGVRATIKAHRENKFGTVAATVECGFDGSYDLELESGRYVLEISASGFIQEYFDINIAQGDSKVGENYTLSPLLGDGEIRIVLEWGSSPMDLDSHLTGKTSSGSSVNVSYQSKQAWVSGNLAAELDIDDTNGYGPETVTIYDVDGTYEFRIHDFTNGSISSSSALANSGATVKVYLPGETQPKIFHVPSGNGVWWNVFRIEQGRLTEINRLE